MTHKPNPKHLPPRKSADEYERELAALRARVEELEAALRPYAQLPHHSAGRCYWFDECSHYECSLRRNAVSALSSKGETL